MTQAALVPHPHEPSARQLSDLVVSQLAQALPLMPQPPGKLEAAQVVAVEQHPAQPELVSQLHTALRSQRSPVGHGPAAPHLQTPPTHWLVCRLSHGAQAWPPVPHAVVELG